MNKIILCFSFRNEAVLDFSSIIQYLKLNFNDDDINVIITIINELETERIKTEEK